MLSGSPPSASIRTEPALGPEPATRWGLRESLLALVPQHLQIVEDRFDPFPTEAPTVLRLPVGTGAGELPHLYATEVSKGPHPQGTRVQAGSGVLPIEQRGAELVRDEHGPRFGHAHQAIGQVDHRTVVVTVLDEHRSHREGHPDVGEQVVVRVGLGQAQTDLGGRGASCTVNMTSSPIIFTTRPPSPTTVSWARTSKRHQSGQLLFLQMLAEHGETDHVGEAHRQHRADPLLVPGPEQHRPPRGRLEVPSPHVLEQACHGGK